MRTMTERPLLSSLTLAVCLILATVGSQAQTASGNLSGLLLGPTGQPLSDVLVSLFQPSSDSALPILTRTNQSGRIHLSNVSAGTYQLLVKSTRYRSPTGRMVSILPGRTAIVTLILQQLFELEGGNQEELGLKALLRTPPNRRLVFRTVPEGGMQPAESPNVLFDEAVFQIYTNAGLGGDYLVFPGDSWGGTSTNFAVTDSLPGLSDYIFAGQLNSGQDSLWKIRNYINYAVTPAHSIQLFMGYGRTSYDQPSLSLLENPIGLADNSAFPTAVGNSQLLTVGFEDQLQFGEFLGLRWGLEINRLRSVQKAFFANPNAELAVQPWAGGRFSLLLASKRATRDNTLTLADGRQVDMANSVYLTRFGNRLSFGTSRHYQATFTQSVNNETEIELALFGNKVFSGASPVLAVFDSGKAPELLTPEDGRIHTRGYRMTVRRRINSLVSAELSYIRGVAPSLVVDEMPQQLLALQPGQLLDSQVSHLLSTQLQAVIPQSSTRLTALFNFVPAGQPLTPVDYLADVYDTQNEGINLFVRQTLPMPASLLAFFGLDFLTPNEIEALVDVRNLLNDHLGLIQAPEGSVALVRSPRSVRGGISLRF